jgi:hypothetical protein
MSSTARPLSRILRSRARRFNLFNRWFFILLDRSIMATLAYGKAHTIKDVGAAAPAQDRGGDALALNIGTSIPTQIRDISPDYRSRRAAPTAHMTNRAEVSEPAAVRINRVHSVPGGETLVQTDVDSFVASRKSDKRQEG